MASSNEVLNSKGSEDVFKTLSQADKLINKMDSSIEKSNKSLLEYTNNFEALNNKLKAYLELSAQVKNNNKLKVNIKETSGTEKSTGGSSKIPSNNGGVKNKNISNSTKAFKSLYDTFAPAKVKQISNVAASFKSAGAAAGVLGVALAAVGVAATVTATATVKAEKNTIEYSRSLAQLGDIYSKTQSDSLRAANSMRDIKNKWNNFWQDFGETFEPILNGIINLLNKIPGDTSESKKNTYGIQSSISASARQSGFTLSSANALAGGTYKAALGLSNTSLGAGLQASDIAKDLSNAWLTGSDAAKQYGIVLNDNVLTGWLALNKGIDIANTEITDAQKQAYRYELMLEQIKEVQSGNLDGLSKYVKTWTQVGIQIDKAKGKLFSFDEVINLDATDTSIPNISSSLYGGSTSNKNNESIDSSDNTGITTKPSIDMPQLEPIEVPVKVVGLESVKELGYEFGLIPDLVPALVDVRIPGFDLVPELLQNIGFIPGLVESLVDVKIPGFDLVPELLQNYGLIPDTVPSEVDITVAGLNYLQQAIELFNRVQQMMGSRSTVTSSMPFAYQAQTVGYGNKLKVNNLGKQVAGQNTLVGGLSTVTSGSTAKSNLGLASNGLTSTSWSSARTKQNAEDYLTLRKKEIALENQRKREAQEAQNRAQTKIRVSNALQVGGLALVGGAALAGLLYIGGAAIGALLPATGALLPSLGMADGGIGTKEMNNVSLFENNKKEAVIPLESAAGIDYLASAMEKAGANSTSNNGGDTYEIHVNLSGLNVADNEASWERVGKKIGEVIDVQRQRRGELSYGGSF